MPTVAYQTIVSGGSYIVQSWDPGDIFNTATYDASGNQTSSATNVPGGGQDYDRNPADTKSVTTTSGPGGANSLTQVYDLTKQSSSNPNGVLESDSWIKADNSQGSDTFTPDGAAYGKTINANQTSSTYSLYVSGVGAPQTFVASTMVSFVVPGSFDLTRDF